MSKYYKYPYPFLETGKPATKRGYNLAGIKFASWTAVSLSTIPDKYGKLAWNCVCDCGTALQISTTKLLRGKVRGCRKCWNRRNVHGIRVNTQYGSVTTLEYTFRYPHRMEWRCVCKCGTDVWVTSLRLSRAKGGTPQCHKCWNRLVGRHRKYKTLGESAFHRLYCTYRKRAAKSKREWSISLEDARQLFVNQCVYCGAAPGNSMKGTGNDTFVYSGIDRVDNAKGYVLGNCVSCCLTCNIAKRKMSVDDFKRWVYTVCRHLSELDKGKNATAM